SVCDLQQVEALEKEKNKSEVEISDYKLSGLKVLLAEDYQTSQNLITSQLKRLSIDCDLANNGRQAVELALANNYDIILMDLQMPEMDGITATKQIRNSHGDKADVVIIAMTACVDPEVKRKCLEAGMNDIIAKPLRICNLANMLDNWAKKTSICPTCSAPSVQNPSSEMTPDIAELENAGQWDRKMAAELFGNNEVMLDITVKNFIADVNRQVGVIQDAIDTNNLEIVRAEAHKIRGGASCVAAESLAARAAELERLAQAKVADDLKARLSDLEYEFNRFTDQVKR
ncbi:MAG: response regulator, partial [Sedimentisphaerales bacterium]|nr:response regulator [Sedimentisphaerales bacterium]